MALTIQQIQQNITDKYDAREIINQLADYIQANPGGGASAKQYAIGIKQASALVDPTVKTFINTLDGTPTVTRGSTGIYTIELAGQFAQAKTYLPPFGEFADAGNTFIPISDGSIVTGYYTIYQMGNDDQVQINTVAPDFSNIDIYDLIGDSYIYLPVIYVYP